MTYPESANVSAGDATLASHYNNLRSDALLLGKAVADAAPLGTILERYESRLEIERLDTTKLRVPASATAPVSLLIAGYLCQAVADVDLGAGDVPAGGAAAFYIFANRTDSSTTFTLSVSSVSTEAANQRRIGRCYWDGSKIVKDSIRSELAELVSDLLSFLDPQLCDGRLTLSTGVPVPDSDVSSSAIVYFTPYVGNRVSLYVQDYGWRVYSFSELTLDISGISSGKNFDVWVYDNAGTLSLSYTEWSNDTLRATAIIRQDGVIVKSGAAAYRYLGTCRTSGAGVTCSTKLKRFCFNFYRPRPLKLELRDVTANWTYATNTIRQMRGQAANKVEFLIGVSETPVIVSNSLEIYTTLANDKSKISIGLDSIVAYAADSFCSYQRTSAADLWITHSVKYSGFPGIGYHYLAPLEYAETGTIQYYGSDRQLFEGVIYG